MKSHKKFRVFSLAMACFLLGCILMSCGGFVPVNADNMDSDNPANCPAACDNLKAMGCSFWNDNCVDMCVNVTSEPGFTLNTKCIITAKSCEESKRCSD